MGMGDGAGGNSAKRRHVGRTGGVKWGKITRRFGPISPNLTHDLHHFAAELFCAKYHKTDLRKAAGMGESGGIAISRMARDR